MRVMGSAVSFMGSMMAFDRLRLDGKSHQLMLGRRNSKGGKLYEIAAIV